MRSQLIAVLPFTNLPFRIIQAVLISKFGISINLIVALRSSGIFFIHAHKKSTGLLVLCGGAVMTRQRAAALLRKNAGGGIH
jgi:hypothetical protein